MCTHRVNSSVQYHISLLKRSHLTHPDGVSRPKTRSGPLELIKGVVLYSEDVV